MSNELVMLKKIRENLFEQIAVYEVRIAELENNICQYAIYTHEPFKGCKTCGATVVECQHEKQYPKKRNSNTCNSSCQYFSKVDETN